MGTTGYTQHEHHHYTHNPLFSSRRPMTFFFAPSPCELPTSRCLRRPPGCGCGFWSSLPREGNRSEGDSPFPAIHHFSRRVDGRVSFWGVWLKPREGGGIHTAGGVASGKRGCDERDAGKKKKGGGRTGEWKVPICLAKPWQSVELISLANLHSHTHQRFLEEGGGGGSGELLGFLFWSCLFRIRGKGKGEDIPRVMLLLRREEGKMGTRENGGMENGLNE